MSKSGACKNRSISRLPLHIFTNLTLEYNINNNNNNNNDDGDDNDENSSNLSNNENELRKIIINKLQIHSIEDVGSLFKSTLPNLVRILNPILTYEQCNELMQRIYKLCAAPSTDVLSMLNSTIDLDTYNTQQQQQCTTTTAKTFDDNDYSKIRHIPSGIKSLDNGLKGGFRVGCITEIVGRTGVGKSQLAMQLCILSAMNYKQGSIYIDTESKLSLRRLRQMVEERMNLQQQQQQHQQYTHSHDNQFRNNNNINNYSSLPILQNIRIQSPRSIDHLLHTLDQLEQTIITINHECYYKNNNKNNNNNNNKEQNTKPYPIRLLILDSIAAPLQREYTSNNNSEISLGPIKRAEIIFQISQKLKKIASELSLCIVVINQVITNDSIAALGMPWFHSISSRILLEEVVVAQRQEYGNVTTNFDDDNRKDNATVRIANIVKSNVAGFSSVNFEIDGIGLNEIL